MYEEIGNVNGMADMHVNLGSTYRILGKIDIALEHYLIGLKKYQEISPNMPKS